MKTLRNLREQTEKHVVMAFGRMNPPTIGHAKLVDKVKATAHKLGADHSIVLSHSQDSKKNPLTADQKLVHAQRFFPNTNLSVASKESPTLMHHAANLHKQGYHHLTMVAGSDRVDEYKKLLHKYNGKFDDKGNGFHFKSINVVSAGDRDPDAEGAAGMSASKMREHAKNNDFESFKKGIPDHVTEPHAKELLKHVRDGMNLHEALDRELYHADKLFWVGDEVEDLVTEEVGTIEYRGTNYVTVNVAGTVTKRWLNEVLSLVDPHSFDEAVKQLPDGTWQAKSMGRANYWATFKTKEEAEKHAATKHTKPTKSIEEAAMSTNNPDGTKKTFKDVSKKAGGTEHKPIDMPGVDKTDPYGRKNRPKVFGQYYHGMNRGGSVNKEEFGGEELIEGQKIRYVGAKEIKAGHRIRLGRHTYTVGNVNREGGTISFGVTHKDGSHWFTNAMHPESTVQHILKEETEEQIDESLVAAARSIIGKDVDPKYHAAASCMLQGSCSKLRAHLEGPGRAVKVKVMQALHKHGGVEGKAWATKLGYMGEEMTINESHLKVGDKVRVTEGPHKNDVHEVIHVHADGGYNVKPVGIPVNRIQYRQGAVRASEHQVKRIDEETVDEGVLASLGGSLRFSVNNKEVSKDDVHKKWQDEAKAEAEKRWPSLSKKIADAKKPVSEETLEEGEINKSIGLVEMDDATSVAKKIGVGNLDPVAGKKKTMADGKKKKTYRSVKAGMAKAHELAMRGMASVSEDVRDLHGTPMIHLVNSYTKGDKKVHVWQNHYGGYDYDVHHHNHKTGESHVENHKTSYDEVHAKLKGQGYKPVHESAEPIDGQDLFEGAMSELHAAMPHHWKDTEIVHGERHRSGAQAIVVRHKMSHGADTHFSTMVKHPDGDWHHIDSWGSLERAKEQIREEAASEPLTPLAEFVATGPAKLDRDAFKQKFFGEIEENHKHLSQIYEVFIGGKKTEVKVPLHMVSMFESRMSSVMTEDDLNLLLKEITK